MKLRRLCLGFGGVENLEHLDCRSGNACTAAEDGCDTCLIEEVIVLCRYYAAGSDEDVFATEFFKFGDNLRYECLVTCGKGGHAQDMHIVFDGLACGFCRGLEQGTHVDIEPAVGVACCYDFSSAVVTVLSHLGYHDTWLATFASCEVGTHFLGFLEVRVVLCFA